MAGACCTRCQRRSRPPECGLGARRHDVLEQYDLVVVDKVSQLDARTTAPLRFKYS